MNRLPDDAGRVGFSNSGIANPSKVHVLLPPASLTRRVAADRGPGTTVALTVPTVA